MENRSINENWEILNAAGATLSLVIDIVGMPRDWGFLICIYHPGEPSNPRDGHFLMLPVSMPDEVATLADAYGDLICETGSFQDQSELNGAWERLSQAATRIASGWGYDAINPSPATFRGSVDAPENSRLRHIVAGCALDKAMAEAVETMAIILQEKERRALAALIPATPTPTRRQAGRL